MSQTKTNNSRTEDSFVEAYEAHKGTTLNGANEAIRAQRDDAIGHFSSLGLPDRKNESWKYTNIARVLRHGYSVRLKPSGPEVTASDVESLRIPDLDAHLVVLVNGQYREELSSVGELPEGAIVTSLAEAGRKHSELVDRHFGRYADSQNETFVALNTAFTHDGVFIYVPDGEVVRLPIYVLQITSTDGDFFIQPRNLFIFGERAEAKIVEARHSLTDTKTFTNAVTEVYVDAHAHVDSYLLQQDDSNTSQVNSLDVFQEEQSHFAINTFTLDGDVVRNNLHVYHNGEHLDTRLYGLFLCRGDMHVDSNTLVDHAAPNCLSDELYKGILDDASTGVFNGKVFVHRDAQKTNAYQTNNSIVLTDDANMYSKPELEIYADDVQCSHGATTGQLDKEGLFYLRTRGLSEERARAVMLLAFARDIVDAVKIKPLREHLDRLVSRRFG